ncbi:MAG TPA: hypothetical protein VKU02_15165 [Gemmataceae bacterium]|nr:hypothetical protein [Gemmataceae bacterium]
MDTDTLSEQVPPSAPSPRKHWLVKILVWVLIGAGLGALRAAWHSDTEGWLGPVVVLAAAFGLVGAVSVLLVKLGCRT